MVKSFHVDAPRCEEETNWEPASASFYMRIQEVARRSKSVCDALEAADAKGRFD